MRNKRAMLAGALIAPALALTGGLAYASTTGGAPASPAHTVSHTTITPAAHPASQARHDRCDWRYGDHRCGWRGNGYQQRAAQQRSHRHPAYQHRSYRNNYGYQGRGGYRYQGTWGYRGSGQYGSGAWWGNGSGCCGDGWH